MAAPSDVHPVLPPWARDIIRPHQEIKGTWRDFTSEGDGALDWVPQYNEN